MVARAVPNIASVIGLQSQLDVLSAGITAAAQTADWDGVAGDPYDNEELLDLVGKGGEVVNAPTGTTVTIDWKAGSHQKLDVSGASGNVTVSYSNLPASGSLFLRLVQGATPRDPDGFF